jgi:hypothetical protein
MLLSECVFISFSMSFCLMSFDPIPLHSVPAFPFIVQAELVYRVRMVKSCSAIVLQ